MALLSPNHCDHKLSFLVQLRPNVKLHIIFRRKNKILLVGLPGDPKELAGIH